MIRSALFLVLGATSLTAQAPPIWRVDARPVMASAGADATEAAQLLNVRGAIRIGSGHVVVANGSPMALKVFGPNGEYVRNIGRMGGGPGEFQGGVDVHRWPGDSILAVSGFGKRHALFRLDGTLVREWTSDTIEHRAVMVHRRATLRVPFGGLSRCALTAVNGLPAPPIGMIREVVEAGSGIFWFRTIGKRDWQAVDAKGTVLARLLLPARFQPLQVMNSHVLGLEFDENDIERIAIYRVAGSPAQAETPSCDGMRHAATAPNTPRLADLKAGVRNVMTAGEAFYADAGRYPETVAEIARYFEAPRDTDVAIISSGSRGWAMAITERDTGVTCLMAIGATVLVGYPDGMLQCGG